MNPWEQTILRIKVFLTKAKGTEEEIISTESEHSLKKKMDLILDEKPLKVSTTSRVTRRHSILLYIVTTNSFW